MIDACEEFERLALEAQGNGHRFTEVPTATALSLIARVRELESKQSRSAAVICKEKLRAAYKRIQELEERLERYEDDALDRHW